MVSYETTLRHFLSSGDVERAGLFAASCAERMAQLFTGVVGTDPARAADVELVVDCLDRLWSTAATHPWEELADRLLRLPELAGEEVPDGLYSYAYEAAGALHYACKYRETHDTTHIESCCNHVLNAAEFISDEIGDGVDRYEVECTRQLADISDLSSAPRAFDDSLRQALRDRSREHSKALLAELIQAT
ncbi:hypothetical protein GTY53_30880 [Streptomyces sp. SID7805]|nr:hypothetical protein [Streptomyces sp. SID7805]MYU56266.1 hypothetical protein [Streptomyces sp. SID7805]